MSKEFSQSSPYVTPLDGDGVAVALGADGYAVLKASTTYYFPLSIPTAIITSAHVQGDAGANVTVTLEDCNALPAQVTDYSSTDGDWLKEEPADSYVAVAGSGWSASAATVTSSGAAKGGAMYHLRDDGATRMRLKVAVGTITGGGGDTARVRVAMSGKA